MSRRASLTRRGWSLVGAAIGLALGSYLLGAVELLVLGIACAVLLLGGTVWLAFGSGLDLALSRRVRPARLQVGAEGRIDITIERRATADRATRPTPLLTATDLFDEGRRAARFVVPPLAAGATARAAYRIPTRRRGRYQVGPLVVRASDPFGLLTRTVATVGEAEVLVRPRVHDIASPVAVGGRVSGEADAIARRSVLSDLGDECLTLREYELGDDLRRVHWRSTARTGDLMIRQNEARWRSTAEVVLDVHPDGHDVDSFELAVEAAASTIARLVRQQRRVELVTSAGTVLGTVGDPRHDVLDQLATVTTDADDRLATVLEQIRAHRHVDLVVAVLGRVGPDVVRALHGLGGIHVIAVLTQPSNLASSTTVTVVDATRTPFATAWNQACAAPSAARRPSSTRSPAGSAAPVSSHPSPSPR